MSASDNSSNEQDTSASPDLVFSLIFRFWLYLISNILSLSFCLFVLYSILSDRALRHSLSNHVIIVLLFICLIYESTDIPFILHYYLYGTVLSTAPAFSRFWSFLDFGCYSTQLIILAWATIERHILIFHNRWVSTKKKRFYVHYLPLITLLLYCFLFYSIIILGPFCENTFDQRGLNGVPFPCIYETPFFAQWEILCNESIPVSIIILASLGLFLRVIWQRTCRLHRAVNWRKQRKMTIELLSISVLYLSLSVPGTFLVLSYEFGVSPDIGSHVLPYSTFFSYYIVFLFPYVCCRTSSKIQKKLKNLVRCQRQRRVVAPHVIPMNCMIRR
jgi:hypothetical protein